MLLGWTVAAALASSVLIVWITLVNFFYLLTQMVMAVEDVGVRSGDARRVSSFVRGSLREIAGIFGVVLLLAVIATIASIVATAGLGLIKLVPLLGLAVLPLQIAAWLVRGFVFQYLALDRAVRLSDALPALTLAGTELPRVVGRPEGYCTRTSRGNVSHDRTTTSSCHALPS